MMLLTTATRYALVEHARNRFAMALIAAYATAVTCLTWTPRQPALLTTAFFCAGPTYGVLEVGFGALLRREVEGTARHQQTVDLL